MRKNVCQTFVYLNPRGWSSTLRDAFALAIDILELRYSTPASNEGSTHTLINVTRNVTHAHLRSQCLLRR